MPIPRFRTKPSASKPSGIRFGKRPDGGIIFPQMGFLSLIYFFPARHCANFGKNLRAERS